MPRFELVTAIAAPPLQVFEASLDVEVHTESMVGSAEQAVGGVTTGQLKLGDNVTWQAQHFGIRWRMTSQITVLIPPGCFIDEQTAGPFERWHHTHHFAADGRGGTTMRDVVDFAAPFGILGAIAEILVLRRYLVRLIRVRNQHIKALTETAFLSKFTK